MDLVVIQPALKSLVEALTGIDAYFENDPRDSFINPETGAHALLRIGSPTIIGKDECRTIEVEDPEPGEELQDLWEGQRSFVLTIKVEAFDPAPDKNAIHLLEGLRNRLPFKTTQAALEAARCALIKSGVVLDLGESRDDHIWSIGALDLTLSTRVSTLDPVKHTYISDIRITKSKLNP